MEATPSTVPDEPQKVVRSTAAHSDLGSTLGDAIPIVRALLPKVPLIAKTALCHTLGVSEHSKHWDLRTEVAINVLRSFIDGSTKPSPISKTQKMLNKDPGVKGRLWVATAGLKRPAEYDIRKALCEAIEQMKEPGAQPGGYTIPELQDVEAEWTGYRAGATKSSAPPRIPEAEKYKEMMREVSSPVTILYFHGGAFYLMDPSSHRPTTKKLAKITKGRVLSVRYRLAPQNPFPAALLDALVAYLNLLYPGPGSFHDAVEPKNIVFGGDSAGANLCLVLLQTLLQFRRTGLKLLWNGSEREIPLPAGVSLNSAWCDVTLSSPSCDHNGSYDYLPVPSVQLSRTPPPCAAWPTTPPRTHLYAEDALLMHPLVSPIVAPTWAGSPPLFVECGTELLTDENHYLATKASGEGIVVVFEEYATMPHCFGMLLEHIPGSKRMFQGWTDFISSVVLNPGSVQTKGTRIAAKSLVEEQVDLRSLSSFTEEEVRARMQERVKEMTQGRRDVAKL
ncbi:hypothetical protein BP5796_08068 [Coleophoma crateriformis]|uniref:Alpha/beta hydrolase fold-3 domain-containing protein n=1 Tax=Coleophoma crateriformis TaxID=565419 RepID=A0A3D8RDT8_9HELO|nr:hypothetical protein BP5796_08068 [Coleophoma crateriformis]